MGYKKFRSKLPILEIFKDPHSGAENLLASYRTTRNFIASGLIIYTFLQIPNILSGPEGEK